VIKDLIKFTAKVGIFAAIVVYVIVPNIPGMPKPGDFFHLPSWQEVTKFVLDPGDLVGKSERFHHWVVSKIPDKIGPITVQKPHVPSTDQSTEDNIKHVLTGGIL
jgi:hypothetical protein